MLPPPTRRRSCFRPAFDLLSPALSIELAFALSYLRPTFDQQALSSALSVQGTIAPPNGIELLQPAFRKPKPNPLDIPSELEHFGR
ncbi:hypothetical protein BV22DRAFT_835373 [Leucogyrophana mollusca]|uniref:Uncharacterized protein n=1 Tax=Leucogyrophana mollusca TaxID=85980 RepID=A0ACB8B2J6_9AGAM|nr:hypothetical protein BV22DRAFT_835373 [Leucogyrophana mollusca]